MNIYIVSWKETSINENLVYDVDVGTCDVAYKTEKEAIEQVSKLVKDKLSELEYEFPEDIDENIDTETNENGDWQQVSQGNDTFEYYVEEVIVD